VEKLGGLWVVGVFVRMAFEGFFAVAFSDLEEDENVTKEDWKFQN
jgi:hypothetical protein